MKKTENKTKQGKTVVKTITLLGIVCIVGFTITLFFLLEGTLNNITGNVIDDTFEESYSVMIIIFIALIASIIALISQKDNG